jgi:ABC-2 type transport system ATP-binding protein
VRRIALFAVVILLVAAVLVGLGWRRHVEHSYARQRDDVRGAGGVRIRSTTWVPHGASTAHPAPAVLLAHGLGEREQDVANLARTLVANGYFVRTWTSRGVDGSGGRVGVAAPDGEVADVRSLVDGLARRDDVELDSPGDPRVAVIGVSHGGGVALLAAESDPRIDAVVPIFAYFDLRSALEPDASRPLVTLAPTDPRDAGAGVLKLRWASELFAAGSGSGTDRTPDPCGNLERDVCAAWEASAAAGQLTPAARALLRERSPAAHIDRLTAPTLIVQGQMDSLFGLEQALALAAGLRHNHAPVRIEWVRAGHDLPLDRRRRRHVEQAVLRWLAVHVRKRGGVDAGPRFTVELGSGRGHASTPEIPPQFTTRALPLRPVDPADRAGFVRFAAPAAGLPAETTTLPGLGDVTALPQGFDSPEGQRASFETRAVHDGVEIIGVPHVRLQFTGSARTGIAFVHLVDIAPDDRRLVPRGLVAAVRLRDLPPLGSAHGRGVDVDLPAIAWRLAPGHRMGIDVTSTDAGYVAPREPATFAVATTGSDVLGLPEVAQPRRTPDTFDASHDWHVLLWAAGLLVGVAITVGLLLSRVVRQRDARIQEPMLRDTPLRAAGLTKRFGDGRVAVDGVDFTVRPGTVVGLVGPNGAGKTTTIRMLLGLVHPSDGFAHVFGQLVRPGVPHLARVGALVEGPGLVPHLSGREHLRQFWSAAGRPGEAGIDEALAAVGLVADADRPVRTWSHGMRQRLGIAQALLGRPELVLLDEPANGLDPAQIAQLRALVRSIAAEQDRAVLLSSHLLGELEQVCTHVVLMVEGRVLRSGTLAEVIGAHADLETAFLALIQDGDAHGDGDGGADDA